MAKGKTTGESALALRRGLEVLRLVSEAHQPVTGTEIGRRLGLHQSWVSRILATLTRAGYVRKPNYHSFVADYGVLALGGNALHQFPLITRTKAAMASIAEKSGGLEVALATLWRGQLIYFHRIKKGHEPVPLSVGFPLHLSSVGLRLLVEAPHEESLASLRESKRRYGWERPTPEVPGTPEEVLRYARGALKHSCLVLNGYYRPGLLGCAIPITVENRPLAALALSGPNKLHSVETVLLWLQEGRRAIEAALTAEK